MKVFCWLKVSLKAEKSFKVGTKISFSCHSRKVNSLKAFLQKCVSAGDRKKEKRQQRLLKYPDKLVPFKVRLSRFSLCACVHCQLFFSVTDLSLIFFIKTNKKLQCRYKGLGALQAKATSFIDDSNIG